MPDNRIRTLTIIVIAIMAIMPLTSIAQDDIYPYDYVYGKAHPLLIPSKDNGEKYIKDYFLFDNDKESDSVRVRPRRFPISVKTNLVYDAALALNGGLEMGIGKDWSIGTDGWIAWMRNKHHNEWYQHYGFDLYGRWWYGNSHTSPMTGYHVGAYAGTFTYDFYPLSSGYQSPDMFKTFRLGAEFGWATGIGKRWKMDFFCGLGFLHTKQKVYKRNLSRTGYYLQRTQCRNLPDFTRLGISVTYTF